MNFSNNRILLNSYPKGLPSESNFLIDTEQTNPPKENEFVVEAEYLSVDPFLRMLMNPSDDTNAQSREEGAITDVSNDHRKSFGYNFCFSINKYSDFYPYFLA